jgi:hypothetical protein
MGSIMFKTPPKYISDERLLRNLQNENEEASDVLENGSHDFM